MFGERRTYAPGEVAGYGRHSTDAQDEGTTQEVQRDAVKYFAKAQGWEIPDELFFYDDGYSGGSLERPAIEKLRKLIEQGKIKAVVVYKLDRLSRRLIDAVQLVCQEWKGKCNLYSTKENIDTDSPVGQLVFSILASFGEFERNLIRERTASGRYKRAQQGRKAGAGWPYGYKGGPNGEWLIDGWDEENQCYTGPAAIIRRIFEEYLAGRGWLTIAHGLQQDGISAPKGGPWRDDTIQRIMDNPVYYGRYEYGCKSPNGKKNPGPHIVFEGAAPPLVSKTEWDEAQRIRKERSAQMRREKTHIHLLSGILRCAGCGGPMKGTVNNRGHNYYTCSEKHRTKLCAAADIRQDALDGQVLEIVRQHVATDNLKAHLDEIRQEINQKVADRHQAVKQLEAFLVKLDQREKRINDDYDKGELTAKQYGAAIERLEQERDDKQEALTGARKALEEAEQATIDTSKAEYMSKRVNAWDSLSREELKSLLHELIAFLSACRERGRGGRGKKNENPIHVKIQLRTDTMVTNQPAPTEVKFVPQQHYGDSAAD